jgi:hypothetical protein
MVLETFKWKFLLELEELESSAGVTQDDYHSFCYYFSDTWIHDWQKRIFGMTFFFVFIFFNLEFRYCLFSKTINDTMTFTNCVFSLFIQS